MKINKNFIFILSACIVVYTFLEVVQRSNVYYHYYRDMRRFNDPLIEPVTPMDRREYVFKSSTEFITQDGIIYRTNAKRLRGKEYPYVKGDDVYRVLMLGDSYLFGWGVQLEDTVPFILEDMLSKSPIDPQRQYEVINAAVYGYNTVQELEFYKREASKYNPDEVMLYFIMNDMEPQWNAPRHPSYEYKYCRSWFFDHMVRRLNDMIAKVSGDPEPKFPVHRNRHNESFMRAFDKERYKWESCRASIKELAEIMKDKGMKFTVFIVPSFGEEFSKYPFGKIHTEVKKFCKDNDIKAVDLLDYFKSEKDIKIYQVDKKNTHPNRLANLAISKIIYAYLAQQ